MFDQVHERVDSRLRGDGADHAGLVHVVGGEVGQGAAAAVFELNPAGATRPGRQAPVAALEGLELGLLVGADDVLVVAELDALPAALVQVEDPGGFGGEVGVTGRSRTGAARV